ncbi:hypothetical protein QTA58_13835 [Neorhizobium sp. CSC1952]|uniref:Uncharacterized protein n=1 Tax=Xaviernesmea oryzae TaxID=464029 RepID=A0A1X7D5F3_9HYPH|nr:MULTISPECIES: hypothetical protein [Rhizobium/Agrobacterium group]WJR65330.1 hypothetical protein QTA58_13835 [Rhizobium sp. CSC1952]SMF09197.1 hypothetical protein SAMN02982989_5056 [Xaviernesmea oryzae]
MERNNANQEAKRFGSSQPNIAKSSGTGESTIRKQPDPATTEINKARKVWDAEGSGNTSGRVADAGDAGGQNLPYDTETQADVVGRQTRRKDGH